MKEHRFVAAIAIELTRKQIELLLDAPRELTVDMLHKAGSGPKIDVAGIGCYTCEEPATKKMLDKPCPGEPK